MYYKYTRIGRIASSLPFDSSVFTLYGGIVRAARLLTRCIFTRKFRNFRFTINPHLRLFKPVALETSVIIYCPMLSSLIQNDRMSRMSKT